MKKKLSKDFGGGFFKNFFLLHLLIISGITLPLFAKEPFLSNSLLKKINHDETYKRAHAERNVLKVLEGDCETAVGVHSIINGENISLEAELFSLDGSKRFYEKKIVKNMILNIEFFD